MHKLSKLAQNPSFSSLSISLQREEISVPDYISVMLQFLNLSLSRFGALNYDSFTAFQQ